MTAARYVMIGLARARTPWFSEVSQWASSAALPLEFAKCLTVPEVRDRLGSGRRFSALLVDGHLPGVDRDLLDLAAHASVPVFVVDSPSTARDWEALGATVVLDEPLELAVLDDALRTHAEPVADPTLAHPRRSSTAPGPWRGALLAVTGGGGTGTSTVAACLAHSLSADPRHGGSVVLADLCRRADQAMFHGARDLVPGVTELVESHRSGTPSTETVVGSTFETDRGYRVLLGLRRPSDWTGLRARSTQAGIDGLRAAFRTVVADVDPDVEGEADTGSIEVEERHVLSRTVLGSADVVLVTGAPGLKGVHRHAAIVRDLLAFGVPAERILPVVVRVPRQPRIRSSAARDLAALIGPMDVASPVFVPDRRRMDDLHHDVAPFPATLTQPLGRATTAMLAHLEPVALDDEPVAVTPGSLGVLATSGDER